MKNLMLLTLFIVALLTLSAFNFVDDFNEMLEHHVAEILPQVFDQVRQQVLIVAPI